LFDLSNYIPNGEWEITGTTFKENLILYDSGNIGFYDVTFEIILRRRVLYYVIYLIAPGTIIALLSGIIFILPQDCSERITVGKKLHVFRKQCFSTIHSIVEKKNVQLFGGTAS
jgi:hypothetical protein